MKRLLFCLLLATVPLQAPAQARDWNQAELDALLAPIALYPDALLGQILDAASRPGQVAQAARWARSNPPGLSGDDAVSQAQAWGWHPSVTALTAFPDILARMDENPQWLRDLADAVRDYEPYVMETVQQLRRRADAAGNLRSDEQQQVVRQGDTIFIQPAYPQVVYVPYYNPMVVFGSWWWTSYRPVVWRPWVARPVRWNWTWHARTQFHPVRRVIRVNGSPSPAAQFQSMQAASFLQRQREFAAHSPAAHSPAARFQVAQAQPVTRMPVHVASRPQVQVISRPQAPAVSHPHVVSRPAVVHGGGRPVLHAARAQVRR